MQDRQEQGGGEGEACSPPAAATAAAVRGQHHAATAAAGRLCVRHHTRTGVFGTGATAPSGGPPRPPAPRCLQHQRYPWHSSAAATAAS